METIVSYLTFALVLTVIMETPVLLIGFRNESYSIKYKLLIFVLVNVITNLTLNCAIQIIGFDVKTVIIAEIFIVIAEAFVYRKAFLTDYRKALLYSSLANAFSGIAGSYIINIILR